MPAKHKSLHPLELGLGLRLGLGCSRPPVSLASIADLIDYLGSTAVALWDASDWSSASGDWTDSISSIALTPAGSPTYSATGLNSLKPAVSFDGATQYFERASGTLPAQLPSGTDECWIWVLGSQGGSGATVRTAFAYGPTANNAGRQIKRTAASGTSRLWINRTGGGLRDDGHAYDGVHIAGGQFQAGGTTVAGRFDGEDSNPATDAQSFNTTTSSCRVRIGANLASTAAEFWLGSVSLILVTGAETTDQRNMIEGTFDAYAQGLI